MFTLYNKNGIFWTESSLLPVKHMFTRRLGDVGDFPYSSNKDPEWLRTERQEKVRGIWLNLRKTADLPKEGIAFTHQVHGTLVRRVGPTDRLLPPLGETPVDCDGLITTEKSVPLCVFTADCVPVLLCDAEAGVICAVHSGWKGTVKDMMRSAVESMFSLGASAERIVAAIGPAASQCCFETGPEVKDAVEDLLKEDAEGICLPEQDVPGKYMVDLKETNRRRLMQLGVRYEHIDVSEDCTICKSDVYWSHRATHGVRGTQASIIML